MSLILLRFIGNKSNLKKSVMRPFKLLCITLCISSFFCLNSYSQAGAQFTKVKTKQTETKKTETVVFTPPVIQESHGYEQVEEIHFENNFMLAADANVFTQKTFSAPLFDDQISVEAN